MKSIEILCVMMLVSVNLFSQGLSKKEIRQKADSVAFTNLQQLVDNKNFEFSASHVLPLQGQSIVLTSDEYSVIIKHDSVFCNLPFYGRAFYVNPGESGGFHFSEPITNYQIKVNKHKQLIELEIDAKKTNDSYKLFFTLTGEENSSLSIISNNRSNISYWGNLKELKDK